MENPYLSFYEGMMDALRAGRKTQHTMLARPGGEPNFWALLAPGAVLPLREWWALDDIGRPLYRVDFPTLLPASGRWKMPDSMPDWMLRFRLEVTASCLRKLQELTGTDALLEGVDAFGTLSGPRYRDYGSGNEWFRSPLRSYASYWNQVYGRYAWDANPDVVTLQLRVIALPPATRGEKEK